MMHLVCLVGSVITCKRRLKYFELMLDSVRAQIQKPDGFFLSIYIEPSLGNVDLIHLTRDIPNVRILKNKTPKLQFVHFQIMFNKLDEYFPCDQKTQESFILFSDDDDLWHPERVYAYKQTWNHMKDEHRAITSSLCTGRTVTHLNPICKKHDDTVSVDDMLECGCAIFNTPPQLHENKPTLLMEYHQYAMKRFIVGEFLEDNLALIRCNRFADVQFRCFVHTYQPKAFKTGWMEPPSGWLYFYRGKRFDYASVTQPVTDQDGDPFAPENIRRVIRYYVEMADIPTEKDGAEQQIKKLWVQMGATKKNFEMITTLRCTVTKEYKEELNKFSL